MRALLGTLLVVALLLAGCTSPGDGSDPADNETDGNGTEDGSPTPTPTPTEAPPPPREQRVDDPDDVDEPGEYAVLPRADDHNDESWDVPQWTTGDRWVYEHRVHAGAGVTAEVEDEVTGTGVVQEVDVYQITRTEEDCGDAECERTLNYTQSDLIEIEDNGYMEHIFVFPLEDGKRWVFARSDGRGSISKVHAEARHVPEYLWPGTTQRVEAWNVVLQYESEGNVEQRYWLGEDQKNVLRREIWTETEGVPQMVFSSTLKTYTSG